MNLLPKHFSHRYYRRRAIAWRLFKMITSLLVVFIISILLYVSFYAYRAYHTALEIKHSLSTIHVLIESRDLDGITSALHVLNNSTQELNEIFGHLTLLSHIPYVDTPYKSTLNFIHIGQSLIIDAQQGVEIANDFFDILGGGDTIYSLRDVSEEQKGLILSLVEKESDHLRAVHADLLLQQSALHNMDMGILHPFFDDSIKRATDGIDVLNSAFEIFSPFFDMGPALLGYPKKQTYLFLMQNNAEVRGSGGFIGNYGILKLHNGEIKEFVTDNIYNLDDAALSLKVAPPLPIAKYFKTNQWFLRDSNWSPDFSESAKKAMWFYEQEGGKEHLDGVIAVSQDFIVPLLRFVGPIDVEGIVFTAENFETELQYQVEKGYYQRGVTESNRKEIIGTLSDRILQRLYKLPTERLSEVIATMQRLVQERQVMVYLNDPVLQNFARSQNWTGEFKETDGDFVMVADSNMISLKTDTVMDKHIDYTVIEQKDGTLRGRVDLYYTNNGSFTWFTTRYRDWVRIYVPNGSTFISSQGAMEKELSDEVGTVVVGQELDKTYFGAYIVVEPRTTKHFSVEYKLPSHIEDMVRSGHYTLLAQKQAGVTNQQFKAKLTFQQPIKEYSPTGFFNTKIDIKSVQLQSDLRVDRFFSVNL
ncbi:MAG: DUF4012 domain-containing protein [bacterium]|nr:DUF4012 domain-containing protein [bacterium]